ncbi:glutamine amidotransferase [Bacillus massiliigorillae]|uniref:glutamine amidotransferase n=1 Tax=Bacillus massiliigorillae TaxID=1243664 RepID=UPI0003A64A53|nr:glutamine amidotransferase [Bacillus massiliigorillae]
MKKLLVVKTGTSFSSIIEQYGDFEDMIIRACGISVDDVVVANVYDDQTSLPSTDQIAAIIITGSHTMVTEREEWSTRLMQWLRDIRHQQIPTLGICYGHQLIAEAFGGKVDTHPQGIEIGTKKIQLTEEGSQDRLLAILHDTFYGHVAHRQTVVELPVDARILAYNQFEPYHAYAIDNHIWGVQFHPEFSGDIMHAYINEQQERLIDEGYSIEKLHQSVCDHPFGRFLLDHFINLTGLQVTNPSIGWTIFSNIEE